MPRYRRHLCFVLDLTESQFLLLLIRYGENEYLKTGKMAGRIPGVHLNERGQKQAEALGEALKEVPIKANYSSLFERAINAIANNICSKLRLILEFEVYRLL